MFSIVCGNGSIPRGGIILSKYQEAVLLSLPRVLTLLRLMLLSDVRSTSALVLVLKKREIFLFSALRDRLLRGTLRVLPLIKGIYILQAEEMDKSGG